MTVSPDQLSRGSRAASAGGAAGTPEAQDKPVDMKRADAGYKDVVSSKSDISLYDRLKDYSRSGTYPFHMPGHKRRMGGMGDPYAIDITEIEGFDDLHSPEGVLKEAQERAARLYGSEETYFLVNGSTAGILTAISAAAAAGNKKEPVFLIARNCHRSVYHALYLSHARIAYVFPEEIACAPSVRTAGRIRPGDVLEAIDRLKAAGDADRLCGIIITSPTYEGVVSDTAKIAGIAHGMGALLIVDEAHGAHFGLDQLLPESAVKAGADLVIQSMHKTLPSLTQTALLHVNGPLADREKVRRFLKIYQTSSPSYVFMAGMDQCIRDLEKNRGPLIGEWIKRLNGFYRRCASLRIMSAVHVDDPGRILIGAGGRLSGTQICDILRDRFSIEPEMAGDTYAVCISTLADTQEGFDALSGALEVMDGELCEECGHAGENGPTGKNGPAGENGGTAEGVFEPETELALYEAWDAPSEEVPLSECADRTAAEFVYLYPPGIPLLVPGEKICEGLVSQIAGYYEEGRKLQGIGKNKHTALLRVLAK